MLLPLVLGMLEVLMVLIMLVVLVVVIMVLEELVVFVGGIFERVTSPNVFFVRN